MTPDFSRKIPDFHVKLFEGKRGLIVGIANEYSIAWGCAAAFRGLALSSRSRIRKTKPANSSSRSPTSWIPLDVTKPGEMEAVFDRIAKEWRTLDFVVHSIAFSPKKTLCGRVIDAPREGFLHTMDISVWSFIRMAHLAEPLMPDEGSPTLYVLYRRRYRISD